MQERAGTGLTGTVGATTIAVGSPRNLDPGDLHDEVHRLEADGNTVVVVHRDGEPAGIIAVRDELRPEAADTVAALERAGIGVTMLTGDNHRAAHRLRQAGIGDVRAELTRATSPTPSPTVSGRLAAAGASP